MVSPDLVSRAIEQISKRTGNYQYFFKKLASPEWIQPLSDRGMFMTPPMVVKLDGGLSFPLWPESEYLARMAFLDPEFVTKVILKIPETDNERIHQDYVDAALYMPPNFAAKIAKIEIEWIEKREYLYLLLPEKLGKLAAKLAENGKVGLAIRLMEELLQPTNASKQSIIGISGEIRGKFDEWQYDMLVKELVPVIVDKAGINAFKKLCILLEKGLQQLGYGQDIDAYTGYIDDYSWIWRPAIEDHKQNTPYGIEDFLVNAVRDAARQLIAKNGISCSEVVQIFEKYNWIIFQRLSLHILRLFPDNECELLKSRIVNKAYFDDPKFQYEYSMLLKDCFQFIGSVEQEIILGWIETGLEIDQVKERLADGQEKSPDGKEINQYIDIWRRDKLAQFHNTLPEDWRKRYDFLISKYGEAEHPEFSIYMSTFSSGARSPYTSEEIGAMSLEDLIQLLLNWDITNKCTISKEGLGRELGLAVSLDPQKYAESANLFFGLEPTYVQHVLKAFNQCIQGGKRFEWKRIISLCQLVLQQPDNSLLGKSKYLEKDLDWKYIRLTITQLIISGTKPSDGMIPIKFREQVWDMIKILLANPNPEEDKKFIDDNKLDPFTYALNSIRGNAIHAVVNYAIWITEDNKHNSESHQGFELIPEVREALEQHLNDPSIAVRSMYGRLLPWIFYLDKNWVNNAKNYIFPGDPKLIHYFLSAWTAYILYCSPNNGVLGTILPIYKRAIMYLEQPCNWRNHSIYEKHLVAHLFTFYSVGTIGIDSQDRLLELFYENASPSLASYVFEFIGRSLRDGKDTEKPQEIPQEMLQRIQNLVDYRIANISTLKSAENEYQELVTFGWTFSSGLLDNNWGLKTLFEVLSLAKSIEPAHLVVKRLAGIASLFPLESLAALKLIINYSNNDFRIYGYQTHIEKLIRTAMYNNTNTEQAAKEIINLLGIKGFHKFRELL